MTKLALGLALAGMFCLGFKFGGGQAKRPPARAFDSKVAAALATPARAPASRSAARDVMAPAPAVAVEETLALANSEQAADEGFTSLYRRCEDMENAWRDSHVAPKAKWAHEDKRPGTEALVREFKMRLGAAAGISKYWRGLGTLELEGRRIELRADLILNRSRNADGREVDDPTDLCRSLTAFARPDDAWVHVGGEGACDSVHLSAEGEPVTELAAYRSAIGNMVAEMLIPLEPLRGQVEIEVLPAREGAEWVKTSFVYHAISEAEMYGGSEEEK